MDGPRDINRYNKKATSLEVDHETGEFVWDAVPDATGYTIYSSSGGYGVIVHLPRRRRYRTLAIQSIPSRRGRVPAATGWRHRKGSRRR
jgi:hypothetical protein